MGVSQRQAFSVMRQHGLAFQHLEPGEASRRNRQAGHRRRAASVRRSSKMRVPDTRSSVSKRWRAVPLPAGSAAIVLSLKIVAMAPPWNLTLRIQL